MEKLKTGEMATLDNGKEYICFGQLNENSNNYVFLMSNFKPLEIRFATQSLVDGELRLDIVTDKSTKEHLLDVLREKLAKIL